MDCQIKRNSQGKIVEVAGNNPTFKNILNNTPTLSLEEAIEVYKHTLKSPELIKKVIERNNGNPLNLAPNGKPSLLYQSYIDLGYNAQEAERLTAQVYSDEFKAWFGDWQNAPEEASKVVDENGMPLVVGRYNPMNIVDYGNNYPTFFSKISELENFKGEFGQFKILSFLNIKTPFVTDAVFEWSDVPLFELFSEEESLNIINWTQNFEGKDVLTLEDYKSVLETENISVSLDELSAYLKSNNLSYDGLIIKDVFEGSDKTFKTDDYIVFNSNQIKSATDNIGTFSNETNDIRFQILGERGAMSLDQAEEVTFRMDNLLIAKDMEKAGKTPKEIRLATGWERGVSEFSNMSGEDIIRTLKERGEITEIEC